MTQEWLRQTVASFWEAAGGEEPFPRDLEEPVLWALPLAVVKLPQLWVRDVEGWLLERRIPFRLDVCDRSLRGCLLASSGRGFILLDGTDPADERRFSLAHEVAHFLVDYLQPRDRAFLRLGPKVLEVLDGIRPPTTEERFSALLNDTPIGVHAHLMERAPDGSLVSARTRGAEGRADRLALELLAPAAAVRLHLEHEAAFGTYETAVRTTLSLLAGTFGLPREVADSYGRWLCRDWLGEKSVQEWLGW